MIKLKTTSGGVDLTTQVQTAKGDKGGYYIPSVDEQGNLQWTPSEAGLPAVDGANIVGPQGKQGEPFKYEDFTSEQLEALRGPEGKEGKEGKQGPQGPQGEKGATGATGATGPQGKQGIQGVQGTPGKDGVDGKDGENNVYVGTTEPTNSEALVWINPEGTSSASLATTEYVDSAIATAFANVANAEDGAY